MAFWKEVALEAVKFVFLVGMAIAGIFAGKKLRDHKTAKDAAAETSAEQKDV